MEKEYRAMMKKKILIESYRIIMIFCNIDLFRKLYDFVSIIVLGYIACFDLKILGARSLAVFLCALIELSFASNSSNVRSLESSLTNCKALW